MDNFDKFRPVLERSQRIVAFTGAGISTESGIPDYRSQGGIWEKFQPVSLNEFISGESKRLLYRQRKKALWQGIGGARLCRAHKFFKELYDSGRLAGVITQNIDGLHEKSGLPPMMSLSISMGHAWKLSALSAATSIRPAAYFPVIA